MNRKHQIQLFWIAFLATLAILILCSGCTTERKVVKYVEKHPEILDNWTTTDTVTEVKTDTVYQDTTVEIYLPGDTVVKEVILEFPCPEAKKFTSDTAIADTQLAHAEAWVKNNKLYLNLIQPDTTLQFRLDSAYMQIDRLETQLIEEITRPPPVTKRPWWALPAGIIAIFATVLLLLDLLYRR